MENDEGLKPQENTPIEEPALGNEVLEPVGEASAAMAQEETLSSPVEALGETASVEEAAATSETLPPEPTVEEKPAAASLPRLMVGQPHPKKTFWSRLLPWVIVALLFFLGGLATLFFALYQPKMEAAKAAAAEQTALADAAAETNATKIIDLTDDYNQALKQYQEANAELDLTKAELEATNSLVADQQTELARLTKANIAYKLLVDVSSARTALEKQDTATARQAISYASADLEELKKTDVTTDVLAGFAEKLNEASSNLTLTGIEKSRTALDTLYTNLLLLINNLP